jgi:phosphinothricin acetyltransferase
MSWRLAGRLRKREPHLIIGGIALPNPERIGRHEKLGFYKSATFAKVGMKFGRWINVG